MKETKSILFGLLLFPILAILICLADLAVSSVKLWDSSSFKAHDEMIKERRVKTKMNPNDLSTLSRLLENSYKDSSKAVPLCEVIRSIRDELPFSCNYSQIAAIAHG